MLEFLLDASLVIGFCLFWLVVIRFVFWLSRKIFKEGDKGD